MDTAVAVSERRVARSQRLVYGRPPRLQTSKRPEWSSLKRFGLPGIVMVMLFWFWSLFSVRAIEVKGSKQLEAGNIIKLAEQKLGQRPWSSNLLILDSAGLSSYMVTNEPRLKSVVVKRRWTNRLLIEVSEKHPAMWWQTGGVKYLLDTDGSIIGLADDAKPLVTVIDSTNLPVKVGDRVVPPKFMRFCSELIDVMPGRVGIEIKELRIPDTTSEVYVHTNKGYLIKFDSTRAAGDQVEDLRNVLQLLSSTKKAPQEYIDLRIEHKAYYR